MPFAFEDFVLDTDRRELRRNAQPVAVEPQVFDLIAFLAANHHRVVSRDEVLAAVWHGRIVSESTITTRINAARRALGDSGEAQRLIRTIHGRGFRFLGNPVQEAAPQHTQSQHEEPAIALLPFDNLSGDPQLGAFAAGITEDLIATLSKVSASSLIVGNATGNFNGNRPDIRHVARVLGVRYLLAGSVRGSQKRLRVTARLVDGKAGNCVWSDRYDCLVEDILAQQDDIVRKVLIQVCAKLQAGDNAHTESQGTRNLNAWLLFRQSIEEWFKFERASNLHARELLERAHAEDPEWPSPLGGLSATYREAAIRGWGGSRESNLVQATEIAEKAIAIGPEDATAHTHLANIRMQTGRIEEGIRLGEKAVDLAPNDYLVLGALAYNLPRAGENTRALAYFTCSRRACPVPFGPDRANEAFVLHLAGQRERAIEVLNECVAGSAIADTHVRLAAAYFESDRQEEAREEIAHVLARVPDATIGEYTRNLPFRSQQQLDRYQDLLRGAGLPNQF